jgi:hypothetical protein
MTSGKEHTSQQLNKYEYIPFGVQYTVTVGTHLIYDKTIHIYYLAFYLLFKTS